MSTNPFRRSSLKANNTSATTSPLDIPFVPEVRDSSSLPLTLDTRVPASTQKHVNFASPPGTTIPLPSYPSSPESSRISPGISLVESVSMPQPDYGAGLQPDPFQAGVQAYKDDILPVSNGLYVAEKKGSTTESATRSTGENAVKDTLSHFASTTRHHATDAVGRASDKPDAPMKQAMDVDAFKRLLLTGDSGQMPSKNGNPQPQTYIPISNDGSSSTDTTSLALHYRLEDINQGAEEPPRVTNISDPIGLDLFKSKAFQDKAQSKTKPPPPKPRHGKVIRDEESSVAASRDQELPNTGPPHLERTASITSQPEPVRRPPTPPMTRRHSQRISVSRNTSYGSTNADIETASISSAATSNTSAPPPPPPSRRPLSMVERRTSADLPPTMEEPDGPQSLSTTTRRYSSSKPPPPPARTTSSSKRLSVGAMIAPPVPPPRRGRGSSRSSLESHRPSMASIMGDGVNVEPARNSSDFARPNMDNRRASGQSAANDILADLAALQREVDEARRYA